MTRSLWGLAIIGLIFLLILLQYRLWFDSGGIRDMLTLKQNLSQLQSNNEKLRQRNEDLTFQIARSEHSKDATESRARNELGMIKKGETFYQIVH